MQENDGKSEQYVRYAPRCKSVRRIYLGRITAVISAICLAVIAGVVLYAHKTQTAAAEKEYSSALFLYVESLSYDINDINRELEKAEISEPLAVLKIRKLSERTEKQTRRGKEISDICEAFSLFFSRAETEGVKTAAGELSRKIEVVLSGLQTHN